MFVDRTYVGGANGANFNLMRHQAELAGKPYFVLARAADDGHGFVFNHLDHRGSPYGDMQGGGCERVCPDDPTKVCGCTDLACSGPRAPGQEHNRRWVVYRMSDGFAPQSTGSVKAKKQKKST